MNPPTPTLPPAPSLPPPPGDGVGSHGTGVTAMARAADWWTAGDGLRRYLSHLLCAEAVRLRPPTRQPPAFPWPDSLTLDERGLDVDSLDRLQLVATLGEALGIEFSRREAVQLAHAGFGSWREAVHSALARQAPANLCFRTSASTGPASRHRHALANLGEEAIFLAGLFAGRRRIVSVVPAHHIYGFIFTVLLPHALGGLPVTAVDSAVELAAIWAPGDLVVGYPEFWQSLARLDRPAPPAVAGVTSTAPCPASVAIAVDALGIELTEVFGSTESGGLGWRRDPDAGFQRFPWWEGDEATVWHRRLPDGRLSVDLPDRLELRPDHTFQPAGRCDTQVQVGGVNVSPAEVRRCLLEHPAVQDAAVRLMRPDEGQRLKAFVVPTNAAPPAAELPAILIDWLSARLPAAQRPRAITVGPALPRGDMGKLSDWEIT